MLDIAYTKVTLDNGMDVIVHENHGCPIVAVNVWYHVGSKNERPGRTGFAHLFEHLMFCLLYTSPSPRDRGCSRMPSSA